MVFVCCVRIVFTIGGTVGLAALIITSVRIVIGIAGSVRAGCFTSQPLFHLTGGNDGFSRARGQYLCELVVLFLVYHQPIFGFDADLQTRIIALERLIERLPFGYGAILLHIVGFRLGREQNVRVIIVRVTLLEVELVQAGTIRFRIGDHMVDLDAAVTVGRASTLGLVGRAALEVDGLTRVWFQQDSRLHVAATVECHVVHVAFQHEVARRVVAGFSVHLVPLVAFTVGRHIGFRADGQRAQHLRG